MITVYAGASYLAIRGAILLWAATVANSLAGYWIFTTGHDGVHRTLSRNVRINEFIAQSSLWLLGPQVNLKLFRWCHFLHHRFANGLRDPDRFFNGAWWTLPFRWLVVDVY